MINIKLELATLILRKGLSMRKVIELLRNKGFDIPQSGSMSYLLSKNRIRFQTVQEILDFLGYELVIREKVKKD